MSSILQKLLKYFSGIIISTSFVFPLLGVFPLDLNDLEFARLSYPPPRDFYQKICIP